MIGEHMATISNNDDQNLGKEEEFELETEEDLAAAKLASSQTAEGYQQQGKIKVDQTGANVDISKVKTEFNEGVTEGMETIYNKYVAAAEKIMKTADKVGFWGDPQAEDPQKRWGHTDIYERLIRTGAKSDNKDLEVAHSEIFSKQIPALIAKYGKNRVLQMLNDSANLIKTKKLMPGEKDYLDEEQKQKALAEINEHRDFIMNLQPGPERQQ